MANKKEGERNIRKLTKVGKKSFAVTIPIEIIRELKWKERQKIKVSRVKRGIIIRDWKRG